MDDDADAKMILMAPPPDDWNRPPEHPHHVAEHRPARSESVQPHAERSSRPGPEPSFVEADVYIIIIIIIQYLYSALKSCKGYRAAYGATHS